MAKNRKVLLTRPKSDSYEDFKAWLIEHVDHLGIKGELDEKRVKTIHKKYMKLKGLKR
jgi:hypothetical protein